MSFVCEDKNEVQYSTVDAHLEQQVPLRFRAAGRRRHDDGFVDIGVRPLWLALVLLLPVRRVLFPHQALKCVLLVGAAGPTVVQAHVGEPQAARVRAELERSRGEVRQVQTTASASAAATPPAPVPAGGGTPVVANIVPQVTALAAPPALPVVAAFTVAIVVV